jgi:ATP-dependent DNA helicase DinG
VSLAEEVAIAIEEVTAAIPGGGEVRRGQRAMAAEISEAIEAGEHLAVQAGTGTGKTLAYLIPTILSGRRTVVATWSKALQDQMERVDLPLLAANMDKPFDFAVLKGWDNYVCLERLDEIRRSGEQQALDGLFEGADGTQVERIRQWVETSESGDRADLPFEPDANTWTAVSVGTDDCLGVAECPFGEDCLPARARQRARDADICVTNHHLYAVDVALDGMLLDRPDRPHEVVVFDEAHQLEEVFSATFGFQLTPGRFRWLSRVARAVISETALLDGLDDLHMRLGAWLDAHADRRIVPGVDSDLDQILDLAEFRLERLLTAARSTVNDDQAGKRRLTRLLKAGGTLMGDIRFCRDLLRGAGGEQSGGKKEEGDQLAWVERSGTHLALRVAPIEVGPRLARDLWPRRTAVLTSATLPVNLPDRLALPSPRTSAVGSPFDYENNSLLFCPMHLPSPARDEAAWAAGLLVELEHLICAGGGRTLALFTSWRGLQAAAAAMRSRVPFPILEQGDLPPRALLEAFAADEEACLFATRSFWQGIDVPGPSLALVVIDRIPFPRPDEPLTKAWRDRAGLDGWGAVDLPIGALRLAQGVGRLIRSQTDQGVVAVFDSRLFGARYSQSLLDALPPMRRTADRDEAESFLRSLFS